MGVPEHVEAAAAGSADGWSALVDQFAGLIWSIARSHGLDASDAADVSQTTWLRFAEHLGRLRDPSRAGAWLATTARRESIRVSRLGSRDVLVDPWDELDRAIDTDEPDAGMVARERDVEIQQAVALLPSRCQRLLRALVDDPPPAYAELSNSLEIPIGSIGPTRARCLRHLRQLLAEANPRLDLVQGSM